MPDPQDPCLEQRNALDAATAELDAAVLLVQERAEALIACEESNNQGLMATKETGCECEKAAACLRAAVEHLRAVMAILRG